MRYHPLSRTTVHTRKQMAEAVLSGRLSLKEAAAEFKLGRQSAGKWVKRYREEGIAGPADRSSRPARLWHQTPAKVIERVERMRREGWTGLRRPARAEADRPGSGSGDEKSICEDLCDSLRASPFGSPLCDRDDKHRR